MTVRNIIIEEFLKKHIWYYAVGIPLIIITNILQISIPKLIGVIVDHLKNSSASQQYLFGLTGIILGLAIVIFFLKLIWRYLLIGGSMKLECLLRERFFQHLQTLPVQFYNNRKTGELMAYAINDLQATRMAFSAGIIWLVNGVSMNLISVVIMARTINLRLTLFALIPIVCSAILVIMLRPIIRRRFRTVQERFADVSDKVQENLSGIRVIKGYVQEAQEIEKLSCVSQSRMDAQMAYVRVSALYDPSIRLFFGISFVLNLLLGSQYVVNNLISLGDFVAFNAYIALLTVPVGRLGQVMVRWQNALASMKRLDVIFQTKTDIYDDQPKPDERRFRGDIRIKRLTFTYPNDPAPTLYNINLHLKDGQTLAIVGDTGSGKTTLVNLLVRLFRVKRGHIFIDGTDINDIPLVVLRENIGYAPQDTFLFSTSIKKNIASFKDQYDDQKVEEASRLSNVYENIVEFPDGFDTVLGERGITLSGGQKQRISLARAIIKNPSILILDDSFSAVDTHTEESILRNLQQVMENRTTILIAHRISTVKYADQIIVLDQGRMFEHGTHEALLAKQGKYYDMYMSQLTDEQL